MGSDIAASSALTQQRLGWRPTGPGLIADLTAMKYFEPSADTAVLRGWRESDTEPLLRGVRTNRQNDEHI